MEEQKTGGLQEGGANTSTVKEQGAKRGERNGTGCKGKDGFGAKKKRKVELTWAGSR